MAIVEQWSKHWCSLQLLFSGTLTETNEFCCLACWPLSCCWATLLVCLCLQQIADSPDQPYLIKNMTSSPLCDASCKCSHQQHRRGATHDRNMLRAHRTSWCRENNGAQYNLQISGQPSSPPGPEVDCVCNKVCKCAHVKQVCQTIWVCWSATTGAWCGEILMKLLLVTGFAQLCRQALYAVLCRCNLVKLTHF